MNANFADPSASRKERIAYLERKLGRLLGQQRHQERLEDLNRLLLKNALQELDASRERAEAANRAKTDFLANMSHEIRTPLNILLGMGELLEGTDLNDKQRRYVSKAQEAGQHLLELINNILEFSKIERGEVIIAEDPFDLLALVNNLAGIFDSVCTQKGLVFTLNRSSSLHQYYLGDQAKIRQVLLNLLTNAVKFTDHGSVRFTIEQETNAASLTMIFTIEDTGIGISKHDQMRIFERFRQVEPAISKSRQGGVGLGLAIVQLLVEKMAGRIELDSIPGRGTSFTVRVPMVVTTADHQRSSLQRISHHTDIGSLLDGLFLLVVDDVPGNLFVVEHYLEGIGLQVCYAPGGRQAVELYRQAEFDVVLMDICMPEIDGIEALRQIRSIEAADNRRPAYIAAMTAHAFQEITKELHQHGFNQILTKPFSQSELLSTLCCRNTPLQDSLQRLKNEKRKKTFRHDEDIPASLLPLVPVLLEKLTSEHQEIVTCLHQGETERVVKVCHANKGVAGMYGFFRLSRKYQSLETSVKRGGPNIYRICTEIGTYLAELTRKYVPDTISS